MGQCGTAADIVHPAATGRAATVKFSIGQPGGDHEAVEDGRGIRVAAGNVIGIDHHAVGIGGVVVVDIAAEYGDMGQPVALIALIFRAGKTAVDLHVVDKLKSGLAFGFSYAAIIGHNGLVDPGRDLDLAAAVCRGQCILQSV